MNITYTSLTIHCNGLHVVFLYNLVPAKNNNHNKGFQERKGNVSTVGLSSSRRKREVMRIKHIHAILDILPALDPELLQTERCANWRKRKELRYHMTFIEKEREEQKDMIHRQCRSTVHQRTEGRTEGHISQVTQARLPVWLS